ncbi:hypothetical protein M885DRAFT_282458 [Pelagophyceae sp. CCMP2097]|nr:hypothetical protein M885DRAFT_282458 [Pelagophyceae sp. CCMP2097]
MPESLPLALQEAVLRLASLPAPKWVNLDGAVTSSAAMQALAKAIEPVASVETLSLRHCSLGEEGGAALVSFIENNGSVETLYLHMTRGLSAQAKESLQVAWKAHGQMHRSQNDGLTLLRKVDVAYLRDRGKHAIIPHAKV